MDILQSDNEVRSNIKLMFHSNIIKVKKTERGKEGEREEEEGGGMREMKLIQWVLPTIMKKRK